MRQQLPLRRTLTQDLGGGGGVLISNLNIPFQLRAL